MKEGLNSEMNIPSSKSNPITNIDKLNDEGPKFANLANYQLQEKMQPKFIQDLDSEPRMDDYEGEMEGEEHDELDDYDEIANEKSPVQPLAIQT
jgi:hypothetical protein